MKAMEGVRARGHVISGAFVFLLLGVFAVVSTLMVLLSAQFYRATVEQTSAHNDRRVLCSYLMNVARGNDAADAVRVANIDGLDVLAFGSDVGGARYETRIYCYDGYLRELFAGADREFEPGYGEKICRAQSFAPSLGADGLLEMRATDGAGEAHVLHVALRAAAGREEAQP